jgi:hypothetical protein
MRSREEQVRGYGIIHKLLAYEAGCWRKLLPAFASMGSRFFEPDNRQGDYP